MECHKHQLVVIIEIVIYAKPGLRLLDVPSLSEVIYLMAFVFQACSIKLTKFGR